MKLLGLYDLRVCHSLPSYKEDLVHSEVVAKIAGIPMFFVVSGARSSSVQSDLCGEVKAYRNR